MFIGGNLMEKWKNMMTENKLTEEFQRVQNIMENEGIGYYILDYTDSSSMPDEKSKKLFESAHQAITELIQYIEKNANESVI